MIESRVTSCELSIDSAVSVTKIKAYIFIASVREVCRVLGCVLAIFDMTGKRSIYNKLIKKERNVDWKWKSQYVQNPDCNHIWYLRLFWTKKKGRLIKFATAAMRKIKKPSFAYAQRHISQISGIFVWKTFSRCVFCKYVFHCLGTYLSNTNCICSSSTLATWIALLSTDFCAEGRRWFKVSQSWAVCFVAFHKEDSVSFRSTSEGKYQSVCLLLLRLFAFSKAEIFSFSSLPESFINIL